MNLHAAVQLAHLVQTFELWKKYKDIINIKDYLQTADNYYQSYID